ncbi:hypothetical protein CONCODRAFT_80488 [Conidiobolus coronatus NRRL 28638]|uniref:Uncharacterized protein n=1 Tax=Conidiobolus coronatus (strain ATCC 28846 / CBS 209.66 / NRRL 28638) TaxID=796925 RepID=A0A137NUP1_CONC2|nr:hypothetical protein CONCODRAFT_80488 [Conidiobolus coronatus NRRL 28638]|eukprot:KXN66466.1 hypothetical protein CONCODRAFT_80488 [Conidiobolus coronatus NRRL 28638]
MIKIKLLSLVLIFILLCWISYKGPRNRLTNLNSLLDRRIDSSLAYRPIGYIDCTEFYGGFNNQLEQLWFLNILAQKTNRGLVEKPFKLIDKPGSPVADFSELVDHSKYYSNLPVIKESEYIDHCGPYRKRVDLPELNWHEADQLQYVIDLINNMPEHICINIGFVPSYDFFGSSSFKNWVPDFKKLVLPNFKFSKLIIDQADSFIKTNNLENTDYLSAQLRRGDYKEHCKRLFSFGADTWAFGMVYGDKFSDFDRSKWEEFEKHCYPSIPSFVNRITDFKSSKSSNVIKALVLTNANNDEIAELKNELSSNGLEFLRFEPKLELIPSNVKWTITHSLAVEMELARRGKYLIGNRHSTIFTNLIGTRLDENLDNNIFI